MDEQDRWRGKRGRLPGPGIAPRGDRRQPVRRLDRHSGRHGGIAYNSKANLSIRNHLVSLRPFVTESGGIVWQCGNAMVDDEEAIEAKPAARGSDRSRRRRHERRRPLSPQLLPLGFRADRRRRGDSVIAELDLILVIALYWGSKLQFLHLWDELIWIFGFLLIDRNIHDWRAGDRARLVDPGIECAGLSRYRHALRRTWSRPCASRLPPSSLPLTAALGRLRQGFGSGFPESRRLAGLRRDVRRGLVAWPTR